ncbi:uncharacterized protein LOC131637862 [Vicia villosa]|uniref:uncharacterized protein LOC131637862 n=1 Tax=Vicia villosa TaxID=3911 RepID=UPI00273BDCC5|nr:uncharacterized protein LOC131637862 [Vicia villosa]
MAKNGMSTTLQRPLYVSSLAEFILQTELPRGTKVPNYTKFGGESGESTIEHIARYLTESGDLDPNENLRVKNFPSSLTKAAFAWFTSLAPNITDSWAKLEKKFHEKFYEGHSKISLAEFSDIKRIFAESIDDYLNRFRSLKARCFTQVPEHEIVQMVAGGLHYSIRKKIDTTFVKSMSQLVDRVRHLKRLRLEKTKHIKAKKEKIAFIDYDSTEVEVDVAEMKSGSAYECRSLLHAQGKNLVENNPKFPSKTYTFDVTKFEEIFDVLVKDGQMVVPQGTKMPPLEQRQKRRFCKYHSYLGHNTYNCYLFRNRVQKSIQEGRLKFVGRKMKINADPLHQEEALFVDPIEINMVEITEYNDADMVEETSESPDVDLAKVYPRPYEDLVYFLYRCKNKGSQVCLCPRCGDVTNKVAAENFQRLQLGKK